METLIGLTPGQMLANMRRIVPGRCVVCAGEFEGTTRRQYCSDHCRNHAAWEANRDRYNATKRAKYHARKLLDGGADVKNTDSANQ